MDSTAAEFRLAALELKAADRQMWLLARRNIRGATAPAADRVRASAMATLPKGGGLNQWVADASIKTGILTGAKTAGVRIVARKTGHDLASIEAGTARHPVFGNRNAWSSTSVTPGFFTKPLDAMSRDVEAACVLVMTETALIAGFH